MDKQEFNAGLDRLAAHMQLGRHVKRTIDAAKAAGQYVQINQQLPAVYVYRGPDDEYHFQEHEADPILAEARRLADEFGLWMGDAILYMAQEW